MKNNIKGKDNSTLKENLIFAATVYESFEALEEALGKLKLEESLFLVYLAKKSFAQAVFEAAEEIGISPEISTISAVPPLKIKTEHLNFTRLH